MRPTGSAAKLSSAGATRRALSYPAANVLLYLVELVARGGGYRLRGVHGWADPGTIEQHSKTWAAGELLRAQARRGRVLAHDARPLGESHPLWLYRIAQPGMDCLAESAGVWPAGIRDPAPGGDPHVFLREGPLRAWQALVLGAAAARCGRRVWVPDQPQWRSARELHALLASEDAAAGRRARSFWSEDVRWLVMRAFADECIVDRTHVYQLTETGARLRPLEWQDS